ncbi:hypothetical protein ABPG74_022771 [Tetrahymena malaccensis]
MLEQLLKKILYGFLQDIIEDFSENDIELSKWKGTLELKNLNIKQDYLTNIGVKIGFPLVKESAVIEKLQLSIPWTKIRSEPIVVKIKGLKVTCRTNGQYNQAFSEQRLVAKKYELLQKLLKQIELDILKRKSEKFNVKEKNQNLYDQEYDDDEEEEESKHEGQSQQKGENEGNFIKKKMNIYKNYLGQIKEIILQNIRIEVEDVVLKLNDEGIATQHNFMQLGIAFEKLLISPANSDFEPSFINPEQIKKEQKKYQIYKLTKFEIFANQDQILEYQNLDFDKQYILHPVDIDIQKMRNNNKEELQTIPQKTTKVFISQVRVELFEKQFKHIRNLLKYKNWNCEMGLSFHLRPNYNENVQGNAKKWLNYLLNSLKLRIQLQQFSWIQARKNLAEIKEYIYVYKQKLEFELEQKMAAYKFANSNLNYNQLQKQQKNLTVEHKNIDINDIEKQLEEREKDLFKQSIQPVDIINYRDIAKIQFRKEQSQQFQNLLKLKKENKNKQQEKQKAKNIFQKALQQEKIKNVFSWLTSKIKRKSSVSSNGNILSEDQLLQNEEEEKEQLLQQEFNQLIESYTEGQALAITQEQMKGQTYIKNKISVEFQEDIQISLMSANTSSKSNQNTKENNQELDKENQKNGNYSKNNNSAKFQRNDSKDFNYELLRIKIRIQQCMKISTNMNTMIKFVISEFDCRHSINSNEYYQKTLSNLDREKNIEKPSLSFKMISQKNKQTNQVSYRFSLNIASHRFILTDVFFSSIASFFSMKQKSRSFLEDFNVKTKQVKQKIDFYLAQQIRKIFGHKITFEKVDVKCGKLLFIFPENFSNNQKPYIEFVIESLFLSNNQIHKQNLDKIILEDRKKYRDDNYLENVDNSIQPNFNNNNNPENTIFKSFLKDSDLMYSIQNGQQSYLTYKTDQFQSALEINPVFNQTKEVDFDDLKSLVQEGHSDDEDSNIESCNNKVYINHQEFANNIENKQLNQLCTKEEKELKIIRKLLGNNYFQSLKSSSLNEPRVDNVQINFVVSKISTHFCQNVEITGKIEKYKILEDFQIEACLKRNFEHQQLEEKIDLDFPIPVKSKSQENKLNEIFQIPFSKDSKQEKEIKYEKNKLPKKRQTVSLDEQTFLFSQNMNQSIFQSFQGQMITEYFDKDKFISKVQLAFEIKINLIGINVYLEINEQIIKIITQYNKIFAKKENIPNEPLNFEYKQNQHFQDKIIRENKIIDEENHFENNSNISEQNFKSVLGSPTDLLLNQENQQQVQNNRLNTTYLTLKDEEFFDAVEDFSQFFKQHSQIFQHPPLNNLEKSYLNGNYLQDGQNIKNDRGHLNGSHIKYNNEEMKKRMEVIRQARNQSYIGQLHSQYLRQKMIKKSSSRFFQNEYISEGYYEEEINQNKMSNDQQQIKDIRQSQQSIDEDFVDVDQFEKQLSLRDLITLDFTFSLDEFRIYVISLKKKHEMDRNQDQEQTQMVGDLKIELPKKSSALIITKTRINITYMPSYSENNQDQNNKSNFSNSISSLEEQQKMENQSIKLDSQQNIQQQQILLAQNKNNLVKSENCLENLSRKKSFDFLQNLNQNTTHVVNVEVDIGQVYITIYKIDKILQLFNNSNDNKALNKASNSEKTDKQSPESIDCGKSAEQKDQKILSNLKTILLIKDSEININFMLKKGCLKFQDSRKQIKEFKEFFELSVDDVKLETDEKVPIKFDFSELRYIEQLESIMNYVQYKIQLGWKFNASYTNMQNKQTEPFVEDMKINLELIQQNYKKEIIYECQNDIQVNFHPALIDNIFILQQTFKKMSKNKNKENGLNSKKADDQQKDYQYELSNQTGIAFKIEFPRNTKIIQRQQGINKSKQYPNDTIQLEVKPDFQYLIEFVKDEKSKNQNVKYSRHDIKVIINDQATIIDLLQSSKDTYIKLNGDCSIVCQPNTYNDRKIVFRSNIKLTNLTNFNFNFTFSNSDQQNVQQESIKLDIQVKKLSEQYIPLQLFQIKYLEVKDQDNDSKNLQTHTYFFRDNIFNYIPIMVSMVMPPDSIDSCQSINEEKKQNEEVQQSYIIIRRLRNESNNIQTQTAVANGFQNVQLFSTETKEIQIVIQYPILLHNVNPLPLDISFLYPNEYQNYINNSDIQIPFYQHLMNIVKDDKQQLQIQEESDHEEDQDKDDLWKILNYNKYKMSLESGQSTYLSSFNIFLMCKVSVELQNYHQFKPLEIFDYKTIKTYWDFLMSSQICMEQSYKKLKPDLENSDSDQEQQLNFLKSSTASQFINQQQYNENLSQYTTNYLQNNPFLEPIIKQKTLQLLNKEGKQMNLIFDIKYSYEGMLEITLKSQYWFLNETEFALNLQIKENRYLYPQISLPSKKFEKTTQFKVPNSYNQNINYIQGSQYSQQTTVNFNSSQQLYHNGIKERKDQVGGMQQDGQNFQNSYKKSPKQNNNFLSTEKLKDKKNSIIGHENVNIKQFDDGVSQLDQEKQQNLDNKNEETESASMKSSYFGINSNNFSKEQIEQLFKTQSQNIQIFTGNFSSEKQFRFEIPQDEIESLLKVQPYKDKNNEENTSHDHGFTTEFMQLEQKSESLSFKNLKYLSVKVNQVSLPEKYQGIKFFILTPIIIIKNSSNHFLSVNQLISSQQSVESSLSPFQTRQLIYDQVHYPFIQLKPAHNFSLWSQKFPINKPSQFIIKINHINKSNSFILLRITISKESSLNLITIEDSNEYPPFKIVNLTNEELAVSQKNFQSQSLFVKMQQNPREIQNNIIYDEKLIDHFLKDFSPFGWDDPFGEETIMISTMDSLLCNLTKQDFQEKNYTKVVRLIEDDIVIKVFQDKQYPKTKIIMILYEKNQKLFDEYKFEENIYQNLTFRLKINKIGISIVDSHPREIIYFQMEQVKINLKQLNKRFEIVIKVQDIQGDYQAAKPLPTPFLVTKKTQHTNRLEKLKKNSNNAENENALKQNQMNDQKQKEANFFQKIYSKISSLWSKQNPSVPLNEPLNLRTEQSQRETIADDRSISSQLQGKMPTTPINYYCIIYFKEILLHSYKKLVKEMTPREDSKYLPAEQIDSKLFLDLQQIRQQQQYKEMMDEDRTVTSQMTGNATPATLTQRSRAAQYTSSNTLKQNQRNKNSKYKSFFKFNYIQQYYESTKINHIEKFKIEVQPIETNIDGSLIHRLIQFINEIKTLLQKHPKIAQSQSEQHQQNLSEEQQQQQQVPRILKKVFLALPLQKREIQKPKKSEKILQFMIEQVDILPISVDLKFSNLHASQLNSDSSNIQYFIMILLNLIGSNKFYFDRFNDVNQLYTIQNLTKKIFNHYYSSIENQIFNIIVNANLIGNPGQLFKEIGFAFVDLINNVFDEVHRSEEANLTEKFYQSTFKSGYTFTKRVAQAFKSSAQVISKSIISELFDHVYQHQISNNILMQMKQNKRSGQDKTQTKEEYFSDINQLKNFKGNFVNLFHTAFLFPLSTPYSLNSVMVKKQQKLDQKKIKSLQSELKVKRYPRAVKKIGSIYCLEKYEPKKSLGKLFFEAFNLMGYGDFEDTFTKQYELMHNKIWYVTKERFIIIDEEQLRIIFNVAKQDVSYIGFDKDKKYLQFKYCVDSQEDQKHQTISMKVLNLRTESYQINFAEDQIKDINESYNSAFQYKNYFKTLNEPKNESQAKIDSASQFNQNC